jgi:ubiquitin conjugation factor E4 B
MDLNQVPQQPPETPDQETMEQIRKRRIAKLGFATAAASPKTEETGPSLPTGSAEAQSEGKSDSMSALDPQPASDTMPVAHENALTLLDVKADNSGQILNTGSVADSRKRPAESDPTSATPPPTRKTNPPKGESLEDWSDKTLSHIFHVSVDANRHVDSYGHKLTFLPNLSQELQESDPESTPKLSVDQLDSAIREAATAFPQNKPLLDYLLPCWKRVVKAIKVLRGPNPQKEEILKEARRLCFSNCIFAMTVPELFRYIKVGCSKMFLLTCSAATQIPSMIH